MSYGILISAVVAACVTAVLTRNAVLVLNVILIGVVGFLVISQIRQSRSLHRKLDRLRSDSTSARRRAAALDAVKPKLETTLREVRAVRRGTDSLAPVLRLAGALSSTGRQAAEHHVELSTQVAAMSADLRRFAALVEDRQVSQLAATDRISAQLAGPAQRRPPAAGSAVVSGQSLLTDVRLDGPRPKVNLVLDSFTTKQSFAGVRTAFRAATRAAARLDRDLRVVLLKDPVEHADDVADQLATWIAADGGSAELVAGLETSSPSAPVVSGFHGDDLWIATYWTTAAALEQAVRRGRTRADRVLYLVQDWEPGFLPWGVDHVVARNTYAAGFHLVVNSAPLAEFLRDQAGIEVRPEAVFAPDLNVSALREAALRWTPHDTARPRVLFYARPSKPRNLFGLGIDALTLWASRLPADVRPIVTLAGEDIAPVDLGERIDAVRAGKTDLAGYYDLVAQTDLGLTLMYSPHPSHLALELPMAGVPTVTNALEEFRAPWVEGLQIAPPTPSALADALERARTQAAKLRSHTPRPLPELGGAPECAVDFTIATMWSSR